MEEKIIEIAELERKFTGFASVPKGDEDTAYVFFNQRTTINMRYRQKNAKLWQQNFA